MKKILSILSTISLSTVISTNIIACNTPNENNKPNKKIKTEFIPQESPTNSNWKLIDKNNFNNEFSTNNNKSYLFLNLFDINRYGTYLSKNNGNISQRKNNIWYLETYNPKDFVMFNTANIKSLYRWDGNGEPTTPTIDKNTSKITNWNE